MPEKHQIETSEQDQLLAQRDIDSYAVYEIILTFFINQKGKFISLRPLLCTDHKENEIIEEMKD